MVMASSTFFNIYDIQYVLLLTFLFLGFVFYVSFLWRKRNMFIKSWNYPGPFNLPLIGGSYKFMSNPENIINQIVKLQEEYPTGYKIWFGNRLVYNLNEPEHIEKILGSTKFVKKDNLYSLISDEIGDGILTSMPQKWKKDRKNLSPSFNQKVLDSFVEIFARKSLILAKILTEQSGKQTDIFRLLSRCSLDIICETIMGSELDLQIKNTEYGDAFESILEMVFFKIFHIWNHVSFIWKLLGHDKKMKMHLKTFNHLTEKIIKQKMKAQEAQKHKSSSLLEMNEGPKRLPLLDYIMESGHFNAMELRDQVNIFLVAGSDTTASTMSFLFAVFGMYPDIQQKVYDEVVQILGEERQPEIQDLPRMEYTERVIKETLRLFPVVSFFLRETTEDVDMGDFVIPKGASTFYGLLFIHRNPKYWPDPLKFDPDRFLPEEVAKRHPCSYIPFSFGPRNCIGLKYGMMNIKVITANLIRKFKFKCEYKKIEDIQVKANFVLRFRYGPKVSVLSRK